MVKCTLVEGISRLYSYALRQIQDSKPMTMLFLNNMQTDDQIIDSIPNVY